jgi:peptide/nickel transport system permease protein
MTLDRGALGSGPVELAGRLENVGGRSGLIAAGVFVGLVALAVIGDRLSPYPPLLVGAGPTLQPPSGHYLFGTDDLGRDVFSRVIAGIRVSMIVGLSSALVAAVVGTAIGGVAGYFGGPVEAFLMRLTELFMVIPRFFLAVVLVAIFGPSLINVILAISLLSWPFIARIVRADFLSLKHRQFVEAARVLGAPTRELILNEILPNAIGPVVVSATLQVGEAILLEASLSYLGLGDPNQVSLGLMIQQSQPILVIAWWTAVFAGLSIFLAVLSANVCGDTLNGILSPRSETK